MKFTTKTFRTIMALLALLTVLSVAACRRKEYQDRYESEQAATGTNVLQIEIPTSPQGNTPGGNPDDPNPNESQGGDPSGNPGGNPSGIPTDLIKPVKPEDVEGDDYEYETRYVYSFGETIPGIEVETPDPAVPAPGAGYQLTAMHRDGDKGSYEDKTIDEIKVMFEGGPISDFARGQYVTSTGVIISNSYLERPVFYNKLTGNISELCPDPLCEGHTDRNGDGSRCVWHDFTAVKFCTEDHIYFTSANVNGNIPDGDPFAQHIYRCDTERNHVEYLFTSSDSFGTIWLIEGDKMYTTNEVYRANEAAYTEFGYLDMKTGKFTALSNGLDGVVEAVVNGYVYYRDYTENKMFKANLNFTEVEEIFSYLRGPSVYAYNDQYMVILENFDVMQSSVSYIYRFEDGQLFDARDFFRSTYCHQFTEEYVYFLRRVNEEEIAASPYPKFYTRYGSFGGASAGKEHNAGGRLFRLNISTMEAEQVFGMTYDGVPICIDGFAVDGNVVYISYLTYADYNNYFNQSYPYGYYDGTFRTPDRYARLDFSNGTVSFIDVSEFHAEIPDWLKPPRYSLDG